MMILPSRVRQVMPVVAMICVLAACTKQNEETLTKGTGAPACDTTNMSYALNIVPIVTANCYSCHGNGNTEAGISLDTYAKLKRLADNNSLVNVINHSPGYSAMPYGLPKMEACTISKIEAWVKRGAPNN